MNEHRTVVRGFCNRDIENDVPVPEAEQAVPCEGEDCQEDQGGMNITWIIYALLILLGVNTILSIVILIIIGSKLL